MTRLINIAIPKSGSGMLAQAIDGRHANIGPGMYQEDERKVPPDRPTLKIMREFTEPFARSHQPYCEEYEEYYRQRGDKIIFLHRDLRDIMVSHMMYLHKWSGHRSYFNFITGDGRLLEEVDDKLMALIKNADWLYGRYIGWRTVDFVLQLKYEDLVQRDRASHFMEKKIEGFQMIIDYLGDYAGTLQCNTPEQMIKRINPSGCNTFRKGIIGDWKNHFKERHIKAFEDHCQGLMQDFGYL